MQLSMFVRLCGFEGMAGKASTIDQANEFAVKGEGAEVAGNLQEALTDYQRAVNLYLHGLKYEMLEEEEKISVRAKIKDYLERAETLKKHIAKEEATKLPALETEPAAKGNEKKNSKEDGTDTAATAQKGTVESVPQITQLPPQAMNKAIELAKKATEADENRNYKEALTFYEHAIQYFLHSLKYEVKGDKAKEAVRMKLKSYLERAEALKSHLKKTAKAGRINPKTSTARTPVFITIMPKIAIKRKVDVIGLELAKEALQENFVLPVRFPQLFDGKHRKQSQGTLLYGPAGTGKTLLAEALSADVDSAFVSVRMADIVNKNPRGCRQLMKDVFEIACQKKPSIVFIDKIDLMCSMSDSGVTVKELNGMRTEFLLAVQELEEDVLVLAATNVPWKLDSAIRRKFEKRIYIPLPDENSRKHLIELHLGDTPNDLTEADLAHLASITHMYSSADIGVAVKEALMEPIRSFQRATHFKYASKTVDGVRYNDYLTPCSPADENAKPMTWKDVPSEKLIPPIVSRSDFDRVFARFKPVLTSTADMEQFDKFKHDFGGNHS